MIPCICRLQLGDILWHPVERRLDYFITVLLFIVSIFSFWFQSCSRKASLFQKALSHMLTVQNDSCLNPMNSSVTRVHAKEFIWIWFINAVRSLRAAQVCTCKSGSGLPSPDPLGSGKPRICSNPYITSAALMWLSLFIAASSCE